MTEFTNVIDTQTDGWTPHDNIGRAKMKIFTQGCTKIPRFNQKSRDLGINPKQQQHCPPTTFSLKVTDRSIRYASPHFWNQLPDSFHQPHQFCFDSPPHSLVNPSFSSSQLSASITRALFHCRLKTYIFNKSFPL